ncbi:hypothetical protein QL285_014754 [Trifolium repens]|nr:hypothetical protein QL285_014754 [Trifolium repens]
MQHAVSDVPRHSGGGCIHILQRRSVLAVRTYLLFVVGTTIFSNKEKNYVDLTFLRYLRDLELVSTFAWDPAALSFLYNELSNAIVPKCKYLAGYATPLQAWIYHHFQGIGGVEARRYLPEGSQGPVQFR